MFIKKLTNEFCYVFLIIITIFGNSIGLAAKVSNPQDPYENFNRHAYRMNDKLDKIILKPIATVYKTVLPPGVMKGFNNVYFNLEGIPAIINDVLQLKVRETFSDTWRLAINSTVGILGFFDVASHVGLEEHKEDLGLTFARWGYKQSSYLVLPLFGSSTVRDAIARPINYIFFTIYPWIPKPAVRYSLLGGYYVDSRAQLLDFEEVRRQAALDPYVFDRDAYLQRRNYLISGDLASKDTYVEDNVGNNREKRSS